MSQRKFDSRTLRRLAEEFLATVGDDSELADDTRADFVTALVRQWITYDGHATVFIDETRQLYLTLAITPLGKPVVVPEPGPLGWIARISEDWHLCPDDVPAIIEQLNLGQSAEVINGAGIPVRLWVHPRERSCGIEPLVQEAGPAPAKRDLSKFAHSTLQAHLGFVDDQELSALTKSVVRQWKRYQGHACLFLDGGRQLLFQLIEQSGGGCKINVTSRPARLEPVLSRIGLAAAAIPAVIVRLNLAEEVEFRDRDGYRSFLLHDPKELRLKTRRA